MDAQKVILREIQEIKNQVVSKQNEIKKKQNAIKEIRQFWSGRPVEQDRLNKLKADIERLKMELKRLRSQQTQAKKKQRTTTSKKKTRKASARKGYKQMKEKLKKGEISAMDEKNLADSKKRSQRALMKPQKPTGREEDPVHVRPVSQRGKYNMSKARAKEKEKTIQEAVRRAEQGRQASRGSVYEGQSEASKGERKRRGGTTLDRAFGSGTGYTGSPAVVEKEQPAKKDDKKTSLEDVDWSDPASFSKLGKEKVRVIKMGGTLETTNPDDIDTERVATILQLYSKELKELEDEMMKHMTNTPKARITERAKNEIIKRYLNERGFYQRPSQTTETQTESRGHQRIIQGNRRVSHLPNQEFVRYDPSLTLAQQREGRKSGSSGSKALSRLEKLELNRKRWDDKVKNRQRYRPTAEDLQEAKINREYEQKELGQSTHRGIGDVIVPSEALVQQQQEEIRQQYEQANANARKWLEEKRLREAQAKLQSREMVGREGLTGEIMKRGFDRLEGKFAEAERQEQLAQGVIPPPPRSVAYDNLRNKSLPKAKNKPIKLERVAPPPPQSTDYQHKVAKMRRDAIVWNDKKETKAVAELVKPQLKESEEIVLLDKPPQEKPKPKLKVSEEIVLLDEPAQDIPKPKLSKEIVLFEGTEQPPQRDPWDKRDPWDTDYETETDEEPPAPPPPAPPPPEYSTDETDFDEGDTEGYLTEDYEDVMESPFQGGVSRERQEVAQQDILERQGIRPRPVLRLPQKPIKQRIGSSAHLRRDAERRAGIIRPSMPVVPEDSGDFLARYPDPEPEDIDIKKEPKPQPRTTPAIIREDRPQRSTWRRPEVEEKQKRYSTNPRERSVSDFFTPEKQAQAIKDYDDLKQHKDMLLKKWGLPKKIWRDASTLKQEQEVLDRVRELLLLKNYEENSVDFNRAMIEARVLIKKAQKVKRQQAKTPKTDRRRGRKKKK